MQNNQKDHRIKKIVAQLYAQLPDDFEEAQQVAGFLLDVVVKPRPIPNQVQNDHKLRLVGSD